MDQMIYAKIIEVTTHYPEDEDSSISYSFTYEYIVNGVSYTGYGHSGFKKRKGQRVKIYYNEMKPEESETAQKHNYYLKIFIFFIIIILGILYLLKK